MGIGGVGASNTDALAFGGYDSKQRTYTETWNGSAWTELNDLNTARETAGNFGTSTAALYAGGYTGSFVGVTEDWNGVSWVEVADLSTARAYSLAGGGTTTAGFVAGGQTASGGANKTAATEEWSGSSVATKVLTD